MFIGICLLLLIPVVQLHAQAEVSGIVYSRVDAAGAAGATVVLYKQNDTIPFRSALADENGFYLMAGFPDGVYRLQARMIGMGRTRPLRIEFTSSSLKQMADTLFFTSEGKSLKEIQVAASRPQMTINGDKKIFYIDQNMTAAGGTAADIMQTIPLVNVSPEGNISMRGGENVMIWINGKPSPMGGGNQNTLLNMINAGNIEKIELLTNPSAKYDADNNNGIINIILKENRQEKLNGLASVSWLVYNKANANVNLGFRTKKVNFSSSAFVNFNPRFSQGNSYRLQQLPDGDTLEISQRALGNRNSLTYGGRIGVDFYTPKSGTFNVSLNINVQDQQNADENYYLNTLFSEDSPLNWWRSGQGTEAEWTLTGSVGYRKTFKKPVQELLIDVNYAYNQRRNEYRYVDRFASLGLSLREELSRSSGPSANHQLVASLDYIHPIRKDEKLELGVKANYRFVETTFDLYTGAGAAEQRDTISSFGMNYRELVNAAYANYSIALGSLNYQFGLRAEYALFAGRYDQSRSASVDNRFFNLFPSGFVSYKLGKSHEFQAGYSMKIRRPSVGELIPFTDLSDPQNIREGNPLLKPEIIHNAEITYLLNVKQQFFSVGGYFRQTNNNITRIRTVQPDGRSLIRSVNQDRIFNAGAEIVIRNQLFKWWETSVNGNLGYSSIDAGMIRQGLGNSGITWFVKGISTFRFWKDMSLQISADYNSSRPVTQGSFLYNWGMDASIRKDFLNKTLSVSFNVRDIFFTRRFALELEDIDFTQQVMRQRESRVYTFSLSYKFGRSESGSGRRGRSGRPDGEDGGGMEFY